MRLRCCCLLLSFDAARRAFVTRGPPASRLKIIEDESKNVLYAASAFVSASCVIKNGFLVAPSACQPPETAPAASSSPLQLCCRGHPSESKGLRPISARIAAENRPIGARSVRVRYRIPPAVSPFSLPGLLVQLSKAVPVVMLHRDL